MLPDVVVDVTAHAVAWSADNYDCNHQAHVTVVWLPAAMPQAAAAAPPPCPQR